MKNRLSLILPVALLTLTAAACQQDLTGVGRPRLASASEAARKHHTSPAPAPEPSFTWYQLATADTPDPLWRFSPRGDSVLLETDPSVTGWGTDYWGYWSDPFPLVDGAVTYTIGLTTTTYTFTTMPDGGVDVVKTLVVQPYLSGSPTTTVTHVGVFGRVSG